MMLHAGCLHRGSIREAVSKCFVQPGPTTSLPMAAHFSKCRQACPLHGASGSCLPLLSSDRRALQRSDEIAGEKNRALKAALNAEMRKTKATLLEQAIPLLEKMAKKGKGLTPEKIQGRLAQVRGRGLLLRKQCAWAAGMHAPARRRCVAFAPVFRAALLHRAHPGSLQACLNCRDRTRFVASAALQVEELRQSVEGISDGVNVSARKPQRVGAALGCSLWSGSCHLREAHPKWHHGRLQAIDRAWPQACMSVVAVAACLG